jgi:Arc/MetJ-type ribon-helix-helix transcriptional regulator
METEKLCVNLSAAEIGKIDVLVARGLYTNRSDVVRGGLYRVFSEHDREIEQVRHQLGAMVLGFSLMTKDQLQEAVAAGTALDFKVIGILQVADDVTPELALDGVHEIHLLGSMRGPKPVLDALGSRVKRRIF